MHTKPLRGNNVLKRNCSSAHNTMCIAVQSTNKRNVRNSPQSNKYDAFVGATRVSRRRQHKCHWVSCSLSRGGNICDTLDGESIELNWIGKWRIQACRLGQPFPLSLLSPSSSFLPPFLFPSLSPPFPFLPPLFPFPSEPSLQNPAKGSGERYKLPQLRLRRSPGRKCIFSIFWGTETCLAVTILLLFVRTKCQWKLKNAHIQLWFCRIVTVPKRYNTKLLTCFLLVVKPFIYRMAPVFINWQPTI